MAFAVAIMVARRDSMLPKDFERALVSWGEGGFGAGERVEKNWWLDQAAEAWLKSEAAEGSRA